MKKVKYNIRFYRVYDRIMLRYIGTMPIAVSKVEKMETLHKWICVEV